MREILSGSDVNDLMSELGDVDLRVVSLDGSEPADGRDEDA